MLIRGSADFFFFFNSVRLPRLGLLMLNSIPPPSLGQGASKERTLEKQQIEIAPTNSLWFSRMHENHIPKQRKRNPDKISPKVNNGFLYWLVRTLHSNLLLKKKKKKKKPQENISVGSSLEK